MSSDQLKNPPITISEIKRMNSEQFTEALALLENTFGTEYILEEDLKFFLRAPGFNKIAIQDNKVIGIILYRIMQEENFEEIFTFNKILKKNGVEDFNINEEDSACVDTFAVHADYRGNGIGKLLLKIAMQDLEQYNLDNIITIAWKHRGPITSDRLFNKAGFKSLAEIKGFWTVESIEKNYECPVCGTPCVCTANFMGMKSNIAS